MTRWWVCLALASALGCKTKDDRPVPSPSVSPQTLFVEPSPRLPGPLRDLRWEQGGEAERLVGEFRIAGDEPEIPGMPGVRLSVQPTTVEPKRIYAAMITFDARYSRDEIERWLATAWGPPTVAHTPTAKAWWLAPAARLRVSLDANGHVTYEPMMTLAEVIGDTRGVLGIERIPLVGASVASVEAAYAGWFTRTAGGEISLSLPHIADHAGTNAIFLKIEAGVVVGYEAILSPGTVANARAIHAGLAKQFGPPTPHPTLADGGHPWQQYPGPPVVVASPGEPDGRQLLIDVGKQ